MAGITIIAADSDELTALTAFDITVTAINDTPQIGNIADQWQYGSAIIEALELTATDIETATCSLMMSMTSSNPVLIPPSNIAYTCTSNSFYFMLTPVTNQSGSSTITIVVTDSGGLTASTSFTLNINLPPELSFIPQTGTAVGEISLTFVEADGDTVSLTVTSSDQSLISDAAITINGTNSNTIELTTTAEIEQTISISLPQESNVHGMAAITIEASAIGGTVSETFNVIVSPPGSGNALTFDGDDDFISFGSINGSHPLALAGSQFSMAFWIKPEITGDSFQRIIDKSTAGLAADGYLLCLNAGNSLKFYMNGMARFTTDSNVLTANMWHHVVVTGDASQYNCYVNGIAVGLTTENSFELPPNATANLYIGTWYTESTREYHGQMDEVSIWNVALTETEVRNYMCRRLSGNETGLVAYFRFDHFTGTTLTDLSGNNFHGTLTHMDNASWNISEVPLGDTSINDYVGSVPTDFSVTLSHSDSDAFTAYGDSGAYSGLHIYLVNEAPSTYTAPAGFSTLYTDHYFGVYPVGITPTYSVAYQYSGNTSIATDTGLRLAGRANNNSAWFDISASLNQSATTLSQTGIPAFTGISTTEFIPGINNAPVIGTIAPQTINEDGIISSLPITVTDAETASCSLNITFNSSDTGLVPMDNISYTCSANTFYLSIMPLNNLTGMCDITITLTDAGGLTASGTLALTVTDVNDVPLISTISDQTTIEDLAVGSISLTVADLEDAPCSMEITITSSDSVLIPNENITYTCTSNTYWLTITPADDQNGLATITVTVIDSGTLTAAYSFDYTVTAVNDAPVLANPISDRIATEGNVYAYTVPSNTFVDVDSGDVLTYTATQENGSALPAWLSFDPSTRVFSGFPTNSDVGAITITITATDGSAQSITDTFVLSVNNTNTLPVLDYPIADQTIDEDVPYSYTFAADTFHDDDVAFGDTLSYTARLADGSPLPSWLTFDNASRHFSGTPTNADVGSYSIKVIAADTLNMTAMDSFDLTVVNVNDAPAISDIVKGASIISSTGLTIDEDTIADAITFTISDIDDTNLTVTLVSSNTTLVPQTNMAYQCTNNSCTMALTPVANEYGTAIITVRATDPQGESVSNTFNLSVSSINDPPVMTNIGNQTIDEDAIVTGISLTVTDVEDALCSFDITATSSDHSLIPNDNISYTCSAGAYHFTIAPIADKNGTATIVVTITDSQGLAVSTSFTVSVNAVNDAPVLANPISDRIATEGTSYSYEMPSNTFEDVDSGDSLNYTAKQSNGSSLPSWLSFDPATRIFSGLPSSSDVGSITIMITAIDGSGESITDTFVLSVNNTNSAPVLASPIADQTIYEDALYLFTFAENTFRDDDAAFGDTLSYAAMMDDGSALPSWLSFNTGSRHFSGTPTNADVGNYTIKVIAEDTLNLTAMDTFILTVENINDAPQVSILMATNLLVNPGAETGDMSGWTILENGGSGWDLRGSPYIYEGSYGFITSYGWCRKYQLLDLLAEGLSATYLDSEPEVFIEDWAGKRQSDDSYQLKVELRDAVQQVLDSYDSGVATISGWTNFSHTFQSYGAGLRYIYFEHGGRDSENWSGNYGATMDNSLVSINIPADNATIDEDTILLLALSLSDIDGDNLTLSALSSNTSLVSVNNIIFSGMGESRTMTITPTANESGTVTITVAVFDGDLTSTASFALTITAENDAPILVNPLTDSIANKGTSYAYTIPNNTFADVDSGDSLTYTATQFNGTPLPAWLNFDPATQIFSGLPSNSDVGTITITITATDGAGESVTDTFELNVTITNSAPVLDNPIADQTIDEDTFYTFTFAVDTFRDDDIASGDILSYTAMLDGGSALPSWLTFNRVNRNFSGTPTNADVGTFTITVIAEDTLNMTAMDSFYLTVVNVNDAPEISDIVKGGSIISITGLTIDEDTIADAITFSISDIDDNNLTVSLDSSNTTLLPLINMAYNCINNNCTMALTPVANEHGTATITLTINDPQGSSASNAFNLTVSSINDQPVITSIADQTIDEDTIATGISLTVTDVEDANCSFDITATSSDMSLIPNNNISYTCSAGTYHFTIVPISDQSGTSTIIITIADSQGKALSTSFIVSVNAVNDAPILANPISNRIAIAETTYAYTIPSNTFADVDAGDSLTYTATQSNGSVLPAWLSFDPVTQAFSGLPSNSDVGTITITITATDGSGESVTDTFELSVNNTNSAPVLDNPIADQTIDEDTPYSFTFAADTFSDVDTESGDTLSYTAMLDDGSALPSWLTFDMANRKFSGTPTNADVGKYNITVIAEDTLNMTAMDSFYLTVISVNEPPVLGAISGKSMNEDTVLHTQLTVTDAETTDCNNLNISFSSSNTNLIPDENISYTCGSDALYLSLAPVNNQSGIATIFITVSDPEGLTDMTSFDVNVISINDIPTISSIDFQNMNENESIQITFTASDIESSTLAVTVISADQGLILNSSLILENNEDFYTLTVTPNTYQTGETDISISVSDGTDSTSVTFSIAVNEIHYMVSGHVANHVDIANSDLQNVLMTLSGTYSYSTMTDASGNYAFTTVRPGSYTLTASKTDDISLDLADAIKILKGAVKLITLNCYEMIAADAYIDGYYGAFDAAKVARYVGGLEYCLNNDCKFWQFIPEELSSCETWPLIEIENARHYIDLNGDLLDQDFIGIGCGNVSQ
jgi:hypothetical protein